MAAAERIGLIRTDTLVLEQRVPHTHSAAAWEHRWHARPETAPVDVTNESLGTAMEHADVLLSTAPRRDDYEYRVVVVTKETTGWVVAQGSG